MDFWVYEHFANKRARIHTGDCRYCNHGKGVGGDQTNNDDKWHGPFDTFAEADKKAASLKQKDTRACGVCKPAEVDPATPAKAPAAAAAAPASPKKSAPEPAAKSKPASKPKTPTAPKETPSMSSSATGPTGQISQVIGAVVDDDDLVRLTVERPDRISPLGQVPGVAAVDGGDDGVAGHVQPQSAATSSTRSGRSSHPTTVVRTPMG